MPEVEVDPEPLVLKRHIVAYLLEVDEAVERCESAYREQRKRATSHLVRREVRSTARELSCKLDDHLQVLRHKQEMLAATVEEWRSGGAEDWLQELEANEIGPSFD